MAKTALVLSGGGAKGAFQVAAEKYARERKSYSWDLISGVSVGALNGSMVAQQKYAELERIWRTIEQKDVYRGSLVGGLLWRVLMRGKRSLYDLNPLWRLIEANVDPSAIVKPIKVGATSLFNGEYQAFPQDHPDFRRAVFASATMPVLWEPVDGLPDFRDAVDGGLRNISPLKDVISEDPDEIVVINCNPSGSPFAPREPRDIVQTALQSLEVALNEIFNNDVGECVKINRLVKQAQDQGATLRDEGGRPYKRYEVKVIEPTAVLDDTLDFSREAIQRSMDAGLERAKAVLG